MLHQQTKKNSWQKTEKKWPSVFVTVTRGGWRYGGTIWASDGRRKGRLGSRQVDCFSTLFGTIRDRWLACGSGSDSDSDKCRFTEQGRHWAAKLGNKMRDWRRVVDRSRKWSLCLMWRRGIWKIEGTISQAGLGDRLLRDIKRKIARGRSNRILSLISKRCHRVETEKRW